MARKKIVTNDIKNEAIANAKSIILSTIFAIITTLTLLSNTAFINIEDQAARRGLEWATHNLFVLFLNSLRWVYSDMGIISGVFAILLFFFYRRTLFSAETKMFFGGKKGRIKTSSLVFSTLLAFFLLLGESFRWFGSFAFIIADGVHVFNAILHMVGWIPLFYTLTELAIKHLDKSFEKPVNEKQEYITDKVHKFLFEKKPFLFPFIFILLARLPIWIIDFPGGTDFDTWSDIRQAFGFTPFSDHSPITGTLIYGALLRVGHFIFSRNLNLAIFLVILFQQTTSAAVIAFALKIVKSWDVRKWILVTMLMFWSFFPWFAFSMIQASPKDVLASTAFLLFFVIYLDVIRRIKTNSTYKNELILLIVAAIISSLLRHTMIFITISAIVSVAFLKQEVKRKLVFILVAIVVFLSANLTSRTLLFAVQGEQADTYNIAFFILPFMQTARFVRDHPYDISYEERAAIDAILDIERIGEVYRPGLSDSVLNSFRSWDSESRRQYLYHWMRMGLRRPLTYFESSIHHSFMYYAPTRAVGAHSWGFDYFAHSQGGNATARFLEAHPYYNIHHLFSDYTRATVRGVFWGFQRLPGISLLFQLSSYTWLAAFAGLYMARKNRKTFILVLIPIAMMVLTFIAGPVNNLPRYFMPIITIAPLFLAWLMFSCNVFSPQKSEKVKTQ